LNGADGVDFGLDEDDLIRWIEFVGNELKGVEEVAACLWSAVRDEIAPVLLQVVDSFTVIP
jgi:hypothetical protein